MDNFQPLNNGPVYNSKLQQLQTQAKTIMAAGESTVTRLARICKGDLGGYPHVNENEFMTFAKANLECTSSTVTAEASSADGFEAGKTATPHTTASINSLRYTYAQSGMWDPVMKHLYVSFITARYVLTL